METTEFVNWDIPVTRSILDNGLTIITANVRSDGVYASITMATGALDDLNKPGLAHFLEHMLMGGSSADGVNPRLRELLQYGVKKYAGTGFCSTEYSVSGSCNLAESMVEALMRIVFEGEINQKYIERERNVIMQEMRNRDNGWADRFDAWRTKCLYPTRPELHRQVIGDAASVASIEYRDLCESYDRLYKPSEAVLVVTGRVNHEAVVEHALLTLPRTKATPVPPLRPIDAAIVRTTFGDREATEMIGLYFNEYERRENRYRHAILKGLIINHPFGMLMQKMRMELGWIYEIQNVEGNWFQPQHGICIESDPSRFDQIEDEYLQCLRSIAAGNIPNEALKTVMWHMRDSYAGRSYEGVTWWGEEIAAKWLAGAMVDVSESEMVIETKPEDITALAAEVLSRGPLGRIDVVRS